VDELPDLLLMALVGHELAHAVLMLYDRSRGLDEDAVNVLAWRWGFAIPELENYLGRGWDLTKQWPPAKVRAKSR
jgi:hypothetical protein